MSEIIDNKDHIYRLFKSISDYNKIPCIAKSSNTYFGELLYIPESSKLTFLHHEINNFLNNNLFFKFTFKDIIYHFNAKIIIYSEELAGYQINVPDKIFLSYRRILSRYDIKDNDNIVLHLPNLDSDYRIKNITTKGLAFINNKKLYNKWATIKNAEIIINSKKRLTVKLHVRYITKILKNEQILYLHGVEFNNLQWIQYYDLFNFIFSNEYPYIKHIFEIDNDETQLYIKSFYDNENLRSSFENILRLSFFPQLSCSIAYYEDKIICLTTVARIYKNTFINLHFHIDSLQINSYPVSNLYHAINEFLINNPYYKYYLIYISKNTLWNNEVFVKACNYIINKNMFKYNDVIVYLYSINNGTNTLPTPYEISKLDLLDEFIDYCNEYLSNLEIEAFSYNKDFNLSELKETYTIMGLNILRSLYKIIYNNQIIAYCVIESYPIFTYENTLDNCIIYVKSPDINFSNLMKSIINEATSIFQKAEKNKYNIILNYPENFNFNYNLNIENLGEYKILKRILGEKKAIHIYNNYIDLYFDT